ncbi:MAG: hypothetical protein Edafosvirus12_3 [Edafosvirus sp.]|uniref:Uncharacterized protein n=1 Tax=Edafosvirus sp. TaxID=2487765 RepID=A0A3G4ZVN8_9VIRU|nr:MAG: hypothetical protein Edafosvirus12_3 [Edafosvirus sp.]
MGCESSNDYVLNQYVISDTIAYNRRNKSWNDRQALDSVTYILNKNSSMYLKIKKKCNINMHPYDIVKKIFDIMPYYLKMENIHYIHATLFEIADDVDNSLTTDTVFDIIKLFVLTIKNKESVKNVNCIDIEYLEWEKQSQKIINSYYD